jgi:hypothetical protein
MQMEIKECGGVFITLTAFAAFPLSYCAHCSVRRSYHSHGQTPAQTGNILVVP